ncbi:MAG: S1 RNA-binding domain-containing protein [Treponemataceae bacterium]|nr:S1 RNA-binding domain-containing protein [Treponemataceae bacterium]
MNRIEVGQEITAEVVMVTNDTVFIDLSSKSEGVIDAAEFVNKDGEMTVKEGDKIKAFFIGDRRGEMRFTTKIAGDKADTSMIENAFKNNIPVEGKVEKEIKGGYEVRIGGARAFCPFSQMGGRKKDENETYVGKVLTFRIMEYKEGGRNILVSNRAIMQQEREKALADLAAKLTVGQVVTGTVKSLQSYGAFVDLDGFQALLPISEVALKRVNDISEYLEVGQEVTCQIIRTDWASERVSLSLKALIADPWDTIEDRHSIGDKFTGKVSRVADFGLFIAVEEGIDGLMHQSTMDVDAKSNLRKLYKAGQEVAVIITGIDAENKRISLAPAEAKKEEDDASAFLSSQKDDGDTYNPFAALLKK